MGDEITAQDVTDMVNSMPPELVCVLAHQSDQAVLGKYEAMILLSLFADEDFAAVKGALCNLHQCNVAPIPCGSAIRQLHRSSK